jgi:Domain of unknown function (DUF6980)
MRRIEAMGDCAELMAADAPACSLRNVDERKCQCNVVKRYAKNPYVPVIYDEELNEYHLAHYDQDSYSMLYYCFFCGGKLPESKRGTFFEEQDPIEVAEFSRLAEQVSDVKSMRAILGEPDYIHHWTEPKDKEGKRRAKAYGIRRSYKSHYSYRSKWKTIDAGFNEEDNGHIYYVIGAKYKGKPQV